MFSDRRTGLLNFLSGAEPSCHNLCSSSRVRTDACLSTNTAIILHSSSIRANRSNRAAILESALQSAVHSDIIKRMQI